MKHFKISSIALFLMLMFGCGKSEPSLPYPYNNNPTFTWGYAQFYGDYYSNYNTLNHVLTLNLFSEGLQVIDGKLEGAGHYLVVQDVFMSPVDTLLPTGKYLAAETRDEFTFFPGKKFMDNHDEIASGAYIYFIEPNPTNSKIAYITSGEFEVAAINDSIYNIDVNFVLDEKDKFTAHFENVLYHFDESAKVDRSIRRKNHLYDLP